MEETCQPYEEFSVQSHKYFCSVAQTDSASKSNEILINRATQVITVTLASIAVSSNLIYI